MYTEEVNRSPSSTDHVITGMLDEVLQRVKEIFHTWHPLGYGTGVVSIRHVGNANEGPYVARVSHANSCE